MARVLRGDIVWADIEPVRGHEQGGRRPVLVVSHASFNEKSGTIIAMAITSVPQRAGYPLTMQLPDKLLPQSSWVKISQVRTISTERLGRKLATLPATDVDRAIEGLLDIVGS